MKKHTYVEMEYLELDELINKTYGCIGGRGSGLYEIVCFEELNNDSSWTCHVPKKEPLDEFEQEQIDTFIATGNIDNWCTSLLMQDMVNKGILEPGEYLIEVCW